MNPITGTIAAINYTRSYDSKFGQMHAYNVVFNTPNGQMQGEISSKSNPFPKPIGAEVSFTYRDDPRYGRKFSAVNTQYAGGGKLSGRPDDNAEGKTRCQVVCAYIQSSDKFTVDQVDYWVKYIMTGQAPQKPQQYQQQPQQPQQQYQAPDPVNNFDDNGEIPF